MAFGKSLVICPPFTGQLVSEGGAAVPGARVIRRWTWAWKETGETNETVADDNGHFRFDEVRRSSLSAMFLPHEPSMTEKIFVVIDGEERLLWATGKTNYDPDPARPVDMLCYVDREPTYGNTSSGTCEARSTAQ